MLKWNCRHKPNVWVLALVNKKAAGCLYPGPLWETSRQGWTSECVGHISQTCPVDATKDTVLKSTFVKDAQDHYFRTVALKGLTAADCRAKTQVMPAEEPQGLYILSCNISSFLRIWFFYCKRVREKDSVIPWAYNAIKKKGEPGKYEPTSVCLRRHARLHYIGTI